MINFNSLQFASTLLARSGAFAKFRATNKLFSATSRASSSSSSSSTSTATTTTITTEANPTNSSLSPDEVVPDLHEPAYLDDLKPKVGYYDLLNLQIKGYDFVVLEKYQSYLHKTMKKMDFQVVKAWSVPCQELQLENLSDKSTAIENEYKIKIYERNLQMKDALVTKLPILIDIINITTPPGISFSIHRHSSDHEDRIYFKDSVLENLKEELQELKDTPLIGVA